MPEVLSSYRDIDPKEMPASARTLIKKLDALSWPFHTLRTVTQHPDEFMAKDPTVLKKAAHEKSHTWMAARSKSYPLGFVAEWENTAFKGAKVLDPIGQPVELFFDYKPIVVRRDPKETEASWEARAKRAQRMCDEQHDAYNDGASWLVKTYLIGPKGQFDAWLAGWDDIINPKEQAA